jgi:hypothetical protein
MASFTLTELHNTALGYYTAHSQCMYQGYIILAMHGSNSSSKLVAISVAENGELTVYATYNSSANGTADSLQIVAADANYIYTTDYSLATHRSMLRAFTLNAGSFTPAGSSFDSITMPMFVTGGYIYARSSATGNLAVLTFDGSAFTSVCESARQLIGTMPIYVIGAKVFMIDHTLVNSVYTCNLYVLSFNGSALSTEFATNTNETSYNLIVLASDRIVYNNKIYAYSSGNLSLIQSYFPPLTLSPSNDKLLFRGSYIYKTGYINSSLVNLSIFNTQAPYTYYSYGGTELGSSGIFFGDGGRYFYAMSRTGGQESIIRSFNNMVLSGEAPLPPAIPVSDIVTIRARPIPAIPISLDADRSFIVGTKAVNDSGDTYIQVTDYKCRSDYQDTQRNMLTE